VSTVARTSTIHGLASWLIVPNPFPLKLCCNTFARLDAERGEKQHTHGDTEHRHGVEVLG
jgi:hypothetical protein